MNKLAWMVLAVSVVAAPSSFAAPDAPAPKPPDAPAAKPPAAPKPGAFKAKAKVSAQRATATTSLTAPAVAKKVTGSYLAGVRTCYQTRLDAGARGDGAVELAFVVGADGATSDISVTSFDEALTACVKGKVASWRFPAPKASGKPAASGFEVALALSAVDAAEDKRQAQLRADAARVADLLSGMADQPSEGAMSKRVPGAELAGQLDESRAVAGGGGSSRGDLRVSGGQPAVGTAIGAPAQPGPKEAGTIVLTGRLAVDDTSLGVDVVATKVRSAYIAGLKRCYQKRLEVDPTATGTLALHFTVAATGRVTNLTTPGKKIDPSIASCATNIAASWRFPMPKNANGDATDAAFELAFELTP